MGAFMRGYRIFVSIVAAIALVMVLLIAGVRLIGLTPYTVISGSMEPVYHVGSVIYVKKAQPEKLKVKDPITFYLDGATVTHRIIEIENTENGLRFYTKGDANNTADGGFVTPDEIIGVPVLHIPVLGYIFNFVQRPPGLYIVVGVVLLLVILSFLQPDDEPEQKQEQQEEKTTSV
ncbi:MAG: signal peptidase I [Clostridia bacterium]|nr:signal peptidase I [Clostridia bacterium]